MADSDTLGGRRLDEGLWLFEGQPDDSTAREALLRRHLAAFLNCPAEHLAIARDAFGKPYLASPPKPLFFNLSHRAGTVLIGTAWHQAVGVDLEFAAITGEDDSLKVAAAFFATAEIDWLNRLDGTLRRHAFLRLWTGKEAVLKARGRGITEGLAEPDLSGCLADRTSFPNGSVTVRADGECFALRWYSITAGVGPAIAAYSLSGTCLTSEKSAF